jgi:hypothetical protein
MLASKRNNDGMIRNQYWVRCYDDPLHRSRCELTECFVIGDRNMVYLNA